MLHLGVFIFDKINSFHQFINLNPSISVDVQYANLTTRCQNLIVFLNVFIIVRKHTKLTKATCKYKFVELFVLNLYSNIGT